jgi:hypothetical protein
MATVVERALSGMGVSEWKQNWTLEGLAFYAEIMELSTLKVWLCQQAITPEEYEALEPPEGFIKSGIGRASHDAAFFRRPPQGNQDGPLETMVLQERTFSQVAIPGKHDSSVNLGRDKVVLLDVHKHHSVMFAKGRTIEILTMSDGLDYVPQVTELSGLPGVDQQAERVLPKGWSIREITLKEDLFVESPFPARVCFFASGHSFQGPVSLGR